MTPQVHPCHSIVSDTQIILNYVFQDSQFICLLLSSQIPSHTSPMHCFVCTLTSNCISHNVPAIHELLNHLCYNAPQTPANRFTCTVPITSFHKHLSPQHPNSPTLHPGISHTPSPIRITILSDTKSFEFCFPG